MAVKKKHRVKDIIDLYWDDYLGSKSRKKRIEDYHLKAINSIRICQTARMGIGEFECRNCDKKHRVYNSCKHRFCSNCGSRETFMWAQKLQYSLPDIKHHHIVFTLPKPLRIIAMRNKQVVYDLLFRESNEVLQYWFKKKHGLQAGVISVLHTSGSDLKYHPHVHMIVSAGGLNSEGELVEFEKSYLCPQWVLGKYFRQRFISGLLKLHRRKALDIPSNLSDNKAFSRWLHEVKDKHWIVNIEEALDGVERLIKYVGRYTRRSCISEYRLQSISEGQIKFSYKDYKNSERGKKPKESSISLGVNDFFDRLLEHVPEPGFKMVRYYGGYSPQNLKKIPKSKKLEKKISEKLKEQYLNDLSQNELYGQYRSRIARSTGKDPLWCYDCGEEMRLSRIHRENRAGEVEIIEVDYTDSS